jgi:DNA-binding transcriptional MocR family regulator
LSITNYNLTRYRSGSSHSGGAPSHLCAAIIDQLFPTGISEHIRDVLQPFYARQYHTLLSAVREHLVPLGVTVPAPAACAGGYFIWIGLPAGTEASEVVRVAEEAKLSLAPGDLFQVPESGDFSEHLRLCFAWEEARHLTEGVRRLACVLRRISGTP